MFLKRKLPSSYRPLCLVCFLVQTSTSRSVGVRACVSGPQLSRNGPQLTYGHSTAPGLLVGACSITTQTTFTKEQYGVAPHATICFTSREALVPCSLTSMLRDCSINHEAMMLEGYWIRCDLQHRGCFFPTIGLGLGAKGRAGRLFLYEASDAKAVSHEFIDKSGNFGSPFSRFGIAISIGLWILSTRSSCPSHTGAEFSLARRDKQGKDS